MKVLFYLQRDYDFIGALMLYCQYLLYLGMFKHSYSHLHNSLARLSSQWVVSRSTCWCSGCTQCKYLRLFTTEAGRRGSWHQTQAQHHCYFSEYLLWRGTWRPRSRLYHATDAYVPQSTGGPGMLRRGAVAWPSCPIVCLFPSSWSVVGGWDFGLTTPLPEMFHSTHSRDSVVQFNLKKHLIIKHIITQWVLS